MTFTRWLLAHTHVVVGWMFNITYSLGLVYVSTWLVVNIAPEAAGAGVAEITAYLNGCFIPKVPAVGLGVGGCAGAAAAAGACGAHIVMLLSVCQPPLPPPAVQ
jgi:hypothetical protein